MPEEQDWGSRIASVVDGWLFPPDVDLPPSLLVPLENPHLHDAAAWLQLLGEPVGTAGVLDLHDTGGRTFAVARPVLGAASAAMLVDAAARRGVTTVIGVGFCGGTAADLQSGHVIAATSAVGEDGVSTAYLPGVVHLSAPGALAELLPVDARSGPVLSVAAVHLETEALVQRCAANGILGLDMETAAIYAVGTVRGIACLTVLVVSDVPVHGLAADVTRLSGAQVQALETGLSLVRAVS